MRLPADQIIQTIMKPIMIGYAAYLKKPGTIGNTKLIINEVFRNAILNGFTSANIETRFDWDAVEVTDCIPGMYRSYIPGLKTLTVTIKFG